VSEFKIYHSGPNPAARTAGSIRPSEAELAAVDENEEIISRTPIAETHRGRALEMIRGRGVGGCFYVVAGYAEPKEPVYVRGYIDEEEDQDENEKQTVKQTVSVRRTK
jgi:hypothetical protein